jgi:hypothetical protein
MPTGARDHGAERHGTSARQALLKDFFLAGVGSEKRNDLLNLDQSFRLDRKRIEIGVCRVDRTLGTDL